MGFSGVFDLIGGRAAWTVLGLPTEGQVGDRRRITQYLTPVGSVVIGATIADVRAVLEADRAEVVAVLSDDGVLLGSVQRQARQLDPTTPVEQVMIPAPGTIRPDLRLEEVVERLEKDGLDHVYVTTASGVLLGLARLDDLHA